VVAHCQRIRVIAVINYWNRQTVFISLRRMEGDAIAGFGRIFAGNENTCEVRVVFSEYGVLGSPAADRTRYIPGVDSERFDDIAAGETALRLVVLLIENNAGLPRTAVKVES
jgi:hypothetical protein